MRKKRISSIILGAVSLPIAIIFAVEGGGIMAYLFAVILAVSLDILTETINMRRIS